MTRVQIPKLPHQPPRTSLPTRSPIPNHTIRNTHYARPVRVPSVRQLATRLSRTGRRRGGRKRGRGRTRITRFPPLPNPHTPVITRTNHVPRPWVKAQCAHQQRMSCKSMQTFPSRRAPELDRAVVGTAQYQVVLRMLGQKTGIASTRTRVEAGTDLELDAR